MRYTILSILFMLIALVYGQEKFVFNETGLSPKYIVTNVENISKTKLYKSSLLWFNSTYKSSNITIDSLIENKSILLTGIKENALHVGKLYFHIKYTIKIGFEDGQYKFEPLEILTKANSKYDMGWKDFNLKNGTLYFKKGKVLKKYKSQVKNITNLLNELNANFYNDVKTLEKKD